MKFGVKNSEAAKSGPRSPISWFGKDDSRIRVLEEISDWTKIQQHFSASARASYPCTGEQDTCPGCTSDDEREANSSTRYISNALDTKRGYVNLYSIPYSTLAQFERASEKDGGTIMARDYTVVQYKEDGRTQYTVEREEKEKLDFAQYESKLKNHQEALEAQYNQVWNAAPTDTVQPITRPTVVKDTAGKEEPRTMEQMVEEKKEEALPPSKPQEKQDAPEEDTITMTVDQIKQMDRDALVKLYTQCGVELPGPDDDLADFLIEQLS